MQFDMDESYEAFSKMLIWRKENNIDEYFKVVQEVGFDVHKVPYAELFEPYRQMESVIASVFQTNYYHKTDKEGRIVDIRLLGAVNVQGLLSHSLKEWIDYNIYVLVGFEDDYYFTGVAYLYFE